MILVGSLTILLIPLIAMQFTAEVNWDRYDFILMAALTIGLGSLCAFISKRSTAKSRIPVVATFVVVFLYLWIELAVGIFGGWGT
ncbi:hypothetical protein AWR36_013305 [Microbulbifer flavimaris]|uniref:Uncharacterized protein n=1 Tax=Microbulbifer flavimaris TaxID=1781068 RepID=A0ABX4HWV7_9GAMM|nr:hypothetical protein AWR36_013305 [Microbulbifer flavimaris]